MPVLTLRSRRLGKTNIASISVERISMIGGNPPVLIIDGDPKKTLQLVDGRWVGSRVAEKMVGFSDWTHITVEK